MNLWWIYNLIIYNVKKYMLTSTTVTTRQYCVCLQADIYTYTKDRDSVGFPGQHIGCTVWMIGQRDTLNGSKRTITPVQAAHDKHK